jgi:regulator of sigma E protease
VSWALTVAGFAFLVIIHEFGHFVVAKATGMRVERFFLFFPPKLVSVRRGETEYGVGAIPLGGFVKISGMNPDEELPPEVAHRAYYRQPVWKRIVVIAAGPAVNVVPAFAILFALALGASQVSSTVGDIDPGSPAARSLQPGDEIVALDGRRYPDASVERRISHFGRLVAQDRCPGRQVDGCAGRDPIRLTIVRDGRTRTLHVTPRYDGDYRRMRIGFAYGTSPVGDTVPGAAGAAVEQMWHVSSSTVGVFGRIFDSQQRKRIHGIVGISDVTHQAVQFGAREALFLIALISLSLAVLNLFPFLPLDGGHIFWSIVEKVRGSPVPFSVMERASAVGFVLVMVLFVIGLSNDIDRLTGPGFQLR